MKSTYGIILLRAIAKTLMMAYKIFPDLPLVSYLFCIHWPFSFLTTLQPQRLPCDFSIITHRSNLTAFSLKAFASLPGTSFSWICTELLPHQNRTQSPSRGGLSWSANLNLGPTYTSYSLALFFILPYQPPSAILCFVFLLYTHILLEQCLAQKLNEYFPNEWISNKVSNTVLKCYFAYCSPANNLLSNSSMNIKLKPSRQHKL